MVALDGMFAGHFIVKPCTISICPYIRFYFEICDVIYTFLTPRIFLYKKCYNLNNYVAIDINKIKLLDCDCFCRQSYAFNDNQSWLSSKQSTCL